MKPMPAKLVVVLAILAAGCLAAGCENGSIKSALSDRPPFPPVGHRRQLAIEGRGRHRERLGAV